MNTARKAPVVASADTVILGGGLEALFAAVEAAAQGGSVLLATASAMLPEAWADGQEPSGLRDGYVGGGAPCGGV